MTLLLTHSVLEHILYMDALDKRECGILTLFAIAMVSTVLCIILFIVVL